MHRNLCTNKYMYVHIMYTVSQYMFTCVCTMTNAVHRYD